MQAAGVVATQPRGGWCLCPGELALQPWLPVAPGTALWLSWVELRGVVAGVLMLSLPPTALLPVRPEQSASSGTWLAPRPHSLLTIPAHRSVCVYGCVCTRTRVVPLILCFCHMFLGGHSGMALKADGACPPPGCRGLAGAPGLPGAAADLVASVGISQGAAPPAQGSREPNGCCPSSAALAAGGAAAAQWHTGTPVRAVLTAPVSFLLKRQWLPKSKMVPLGIDETIDKLKMMEGRNSSIRKAVRIAFDRAVNHLSRVHGEPASDLSDID